MTPLTSFEQRVFMLKIILPLEAIERETEKQIQRDTHGQTDRHDLPLFHLFLIANGLAKSFYWAGTISQAYYTN